MSCDLGKLREALRKHLINVKGLQQDGQTLSGEGVTQLIDELVDIFVAKQSKKKMFDRSDSELTQEVLAEVRVAQDLQKKAILHDHITQETQLELISKADDPLGALEALLVGKIKTFDREGGLGPQTGSRNSIDTMQHTEREAELGALENDLKEANVLDIFRDTKMEQTIYTVGYKVLKDPEFKATGAKEKAAEKIARILIKNWEARANTSRKYAVHKSRSEDAFEEIFGLMGHDTTTLYKADKDEWKAFMRDNMDTENTVLVDHEGAVLRHDSAESMDIYLDNLWDTIVSGRNMIYNGESYNFANTGMNPFVQRIQNIVRKAYTGKRNVAAKESTPAQIKFKSGEAAKMYKDKYIKRSLVESVYNQITGQVNNNVLLRELGTNPNIAIRSMLNKTVSIVKDRIKKAQAEIRELKKVRSAKNTKKIKSLEKEIGFSTKRLRASEVEIESGLPRRFRHWMAELDGSANILEAGEFANHVAFYSRAVRVGQVMAKLGQATISAFGDIAFQVGALTNSGMSGTEALFRTIGNIFDGLGGQSKIRRKYANSLGLGIQMFKGSLFAKVGIGTNNYPGVLTRLQNQFFNLNLMSWWNDSHAIGMGFTFMNHIASHKNKSFDKLMPDVRKTLQDYRIGAKEWDILRKHAVKKFEGRDEIFSVMDMEFKGTLKDDINAAIKDASDFKNIDTVIKGESLRFIRNPSDYLDTIKRRFTTMVNDTSRNGIMIPGAWEQALMKQGTKAGSGMGEFMRHAMLFKTFPVTVVRKAMLNKLYAKSYTGENNYMGMFTLILGSSILGMVAIQTKEAFKGRTPRAFNARFVMDSIMQGGALGIYGDMVLGNMYGRSLADQLGGPTASLAEDILEVLYADLNKKPAELARLLKNNAPYQNLFYGRMIQDYLLYNWLFELSNPGYLQREERRIMRDSEQRYFVPRSM